MIVHDGSNLIKDEIKIALRRRIKEIEEDADRKIASINSQADLKIASIKDGILSEAKEKAKGVKSRFHARTNIEIRNMMLEFYGKEIAGTVDEAILELDSRDLSGISDEIDSLFLKGMSKISGDKIVLIGNEKTLGYFDEKKVGKLILDSGRRAKVSFEKRDMGGGIIFHDTENNMFLDYSFSGIFLSMKDEVLRSTHNILFE